MQVLLDLQIIVLRRNSSSYLKLWKVSTLNFIYRRFTTMRLKENRFPPWRGLLIIWFEWLIELSWQLTLSVSSVQTSPSSISHPRATANLASLLRHELHKTARRFIHASVTSLITRVLVSISILELGRYSCSCRRDGGAPSTRVCAAGLSGSIDWRRAFRRRGALFKDWSLVHVRELLLGF